MEDVKIDEQIISMFKSKNPDAVKYVYEKMGKKLLATALFILNSEESAKDAVQDTFIKALQAAPKLKDNMYFEAWLIKILKNRCIDILRKESKNISIEDTNESVLATYTKDLENVELIGVLSKLKKDERLAVIYTYLWGMDSKTAAKTLGCGAGALRMRVNRALIKLREHMEV